MNKRTLCILAVFFLLAPTISAHVDETEEEKTEPPAFFEIVWLIHSWTHWLVWIGFLYTCYYFRFLVGRLLGHPLSCMSPEKQISYKRESKIKQFHGFFVWLMFIWTIVHASELIGELLGYEHPIVYSFGPSIPFAEVWEWAYVAAIFLFLASCHSVRYLFGSGTRCFSCQTFGKQRQQIFNIQTFLNNFHGYFFWIAIIAGILLLLSGGHL